MDIDGRMKAIEDRIAELDAKVAAHTELGPPIGPFVPAIPQPNTPSEVGYVYHGTVRDRVVEMAKAGVTPQEPKGVIKGETWPDGSREPRAYWSEVAGLVWQFVPEEGQGVVLRAPRTATTFQSERPGELYTTSTIPPTSIEVLSQDGRWWPLLRAYPPPSTPVSQAAGGVPWMDERPSLADWVSGVSGSPGYVADLGVARSTPCIRLHLTGDTYLVYSKGIVGALDRDQQALYCQTGYTEREASPRQKSRLEAMREGAKVCSAQAKGATTGTHLENYYSCLGEYLRHKGVEL